MLGFFTRLLRREPRPVTHEVYIVLSPFGEGREGILTASVPGSGRPEAMPLISTERHQVDRLVEIAKHSGRPFRVVRMSNPVDVSDDFVD